MKRFTQALLVAALVGVVSVDAKTTAKKRKRPPQDIPAPEDDYTFDYESPSIEDIEHPKDTAKHEDPEPVAEPEAVPVEDDKHKKHKKHSSSSDSRSRSRSRDRKKSAKKDSRSRSPPPR